MPSAKGTILLTGANGGLGIQIVSRILADDPARARDHHGLYAVRNTETAHSLRAVLEPRAAEVGHPYNLVSMDLSSLDAVRRAAEDVNNRVARGKIPPIRALIMNAAFQDTRNHSLTVDGFETTSQSNYLSHYLLTLLLMRSMDQEKGRIVVLGSWAHDTEDKQNRMGPYAAMYSPEEYRQIFQSTDPADEDAVESLLRGTWSSTIHHPGEEPGNPGMRRYGASKLCQVMMMQELAFRLEDARGRSNSPVGKIATLAVDPGAMGTLLTRRSGWLMGYFGQQLLMAYIVCPLLCWWDPNGMFRTTHKSAGDVLRAAFESEKELLSKVQQVSGDNAQKAAVEKERKGINGLYLNGQLVAQPSKEVRDRAKTERLWRVSWRVAGVQEEDTVLSPPY